MSQEVADEPSRREIAALLIYVGALVFAMGVSNIIGPLLALGFVIEAYWETPFPTVAMVLLFAGTLLPLVASLLLPWKAPAGALTRHAGLGWALTSTAWLAVVLHNYLPSSSVSGDVFVDFSAMAVTGAIVSAALLVLRRRIFRPAILRIVSPLLLIAVFFQLASWVSFRNRFGDDGLASAGYLIAFAFICLGTYEAVRGWKTLWEGQSLAVAVLLGWLPVMLFASSLLIGAYG